jgi:hypothetical protein
VYNVIESNVDSVCITDRAGPTPQTLGGGGGRKKIFSNILARLRKLWGGVKKFCQIYYVKTKAFTDFLIFLNINSSKKKLKSKNFQLLGGRYTPQAPPVGPALITDFIHSISYMCISYFFICNNYLIFM